MVVRLFSNPICPACELLLKLSFLNPAESTTKQKGSTPSLFVGVVLALQISEVGYDDEAFDAMRLILDGVQKELSVLRAVSASCPASPGRKSRSPTGRRQKTRPLSARP